MKVNRHGADWIALRNRNRQQIEKWREELESLEVTPDRAHQLRGMIFALKEQIEHVDPTPQPDVKEPHYG